MPFFVWENSAGKRIPQKVASLKGLLNDIFYCIIIAINVFINRILLFYILRIL
jgi:hypothetical protein